MIKAILAWAGGVNLIPWAIGACVLLFAGVVALWQIEAAQRAAAELRLTAVQGQLATANAALEDRANVMAALGRQEQATRDLQAELEPTRRAIYAAPRTTACVASPVVRAGLDSLRTARARGATTASAGAGAQPDDVPAAPAGAGHRTGR